MADPYGAHNRGASTFGRKGYVVTPGASDLSTVAKGLFILADGDVTYVPAGNADSDTLTGTFSAGSIIPYQVRRVTAATATVATIED